jgi:hypothetical protein
VNLGDAGQPADALLAGHALVDAVRDERVESTQHIGIA